MSAISSSSPQVISREQFDPAGGRLAVIIPVLNEERTVGTIIRLALLQSSVGQVIVVDDGSTDRTFQVAERFGRISRVTVLRHDRNRGKGAAVRTGLAAVKMPIVIIQDADLEYDPADYGQLIAPIVEGSADVVYGVRQFVSQSAFSFWYVVGNRTLTTATNLLYNCYVRDVATGFKAMRTDLMRRLNVTVNRFAIDAEITARLVRLGYRIHEVPIIYHPRPRSAGKKVTYADGFRALASLLAVRLATRTDLFGGKDEYHQARLAELAVPPRMRRLATIDQDDPDDIVVSFVNEHAHADVESAS
jgi:glycosyltransferase involved in cell wall biosynthesis